MPRPLLEAEKRRAAETAANFQIIAASMNGVENALFLLVNGQNGTIVDSLRLYLRPAIAQIMSIGPVASAPILPLRPASNIIYWQNPPPGSSTNQSI